MWAQGFGRRQKKELALCWIEEHCAGFHSSMWGAASVVAKGNSNVQDVGMGWLRGLGCPDTVSSWKNPNVALVQMISLLLAPSPAALVSPQVWAQQCSQRS